MAKFVHGQLMSPAPIHGGTDPVHGGKLSPVHGSGNNTPTKLPIFKAAVAGVQAQTSRARILAVGSSLFCGLHGSDLPANFADNDSFKNAPPALLAPKFTAGGIPAVSNGFFGDQNYAALNGGLASYYAHNPQLSLGSGTWTTSNQVPDQGIAGSPLITNVSGSYLHFVPPGNVTTFELYYDRVNSALLNYVVDAGGVVQVNTGTAGGVTKVTTSPVALGSHYLNFQLDNASSAFLVVRGALAYNAGQKAIDIINAGWSGGKVANWADASGLTTFASMIPALAPNLVLIETPINDALQATSLAAYETSLRSLVAACKAAGADVWIVLSPASNTASISAATRDTYDQKAKLVAADNNLGVTDLVARMGTWATLNAAGKMYDNVHPNNVGYADMATYIYQDLAAQIA